MDASIDHRHDSQTWPSDGPPIIPVDFCCPSSETTRQTHFNAGYQRQVPYAYRKNQSDSSACPERPEQLATGKVDLCAIRSGQRSVRDGPLYAAPSAEFLRRAFLLGGPLVKLRQRVFPYEVPD
jgi:hypothetical protein